MKTKTITMLFISLFLVMCEFEEPIAVDAEQKAGLSFIQAPLFRVDYDEKMETFALHWPGSVIHNPGLAKTTGEGEDNLLLTDYQAVHTTIAFDDSGYFHYRKTHIEGDESIRMPMDMWEATEDIRPARSPNENPVNRIIFSDGMLRLIGEDGTVISETPYDPEEYRVDPAVLESIAAAAQCDTCPDPRIDEIIKRFEENGVNYAILDEYHVLVSTEMINDDYFRNVEKVIDLRTGQVVKSVLYRSDGRIDAIHFSRYDFFNGHPVETNSAAYHYGDVDGKWDKRTVTYRERTNISVTFKR